MGGLFCPASAQAASRISSLRSSGSSRTVAEIRRNVKALLSEAEQIDAQEDERFGAERRGDELPAELARRQSRLVKIKEAKEALEAEAREAEAARRAELQKQGKKPRAPRDGRDPFAPKPKAQRNFTDPESKIMKTSDGSYHQCYSGQAVVDAQAQVIVVAELSDQAPDAQQLEPALDQLKENLGAIDAQLPEGAVLTADAGCFSEENVRITSEHGLDPHIATGRFKHDEPPPPALRGPIPKHATAKQRMAPQAADEEGRRDLQAAQGDRRASVRPDRHRPRRPTSADPRQARRPRPMALHLRDPQPTQAALSRRPGAPERQLRGGLQEQRPRRRRFLGLTSPASDRPGSADHTPSAPPGSPSSPLTSSASR